MSETISESEEDFDFIDPSILQQFQRTSISIEKIQKEIFNFDEKGETIDIRVCCKIIVYNNSSRSNNSSDDDDIYGEKATRNFEFQIQVNRILQIFDEMIKKIETLLCIQEFVKDRKLMEKYFTDDDINGLTKYCSSKTLDMDLNDENENKNISRLIQLLLSSDLHLYAESYKDNVKHFRIQSTDFPPTNILHSIKNFFCLCRSRFKRKCFCRALRNCAP